MNLELWQNSLPEMMKWKDTAPPSNNINVTRMRERSKYYGARYIIHRPLLFHALHCAGLPHPQTLQHQSSHPRGPFSLAGISAGFGLITAQSTSSERGASSNMGIADHSGPLSFQRGSMGTIAYRDIPSKLRRACNVCIDSATLSTEALMELKVARL
jgi:hypothetical protein